MSKRASSARAAERLAKAFESSIFDFDEDEFETTNHTTYAGILHFSLTLVGHI
jgi:hypothetical protein